MVAATITCLLWRSKSFREKVQSLYFPERYYFRGDRAKSIKKSDPSIFYCCCNLSLLWIFCVIEHKIINLSSPSRPKFKNKAKRKQKLAAAITTCEVRMFIKHFVSSCFPWTILFSGDRTKAVNKSYPQNFPSLKSSFSNSWSISHEKNSFFL